MDQARQIEAQLKMFERRLANAAVYIARGENRQGSAFLHFDDWKGSSGHPLWIKNRMIPATLKAQAAKEAALESIANKRRVKSLQQRRRRRVPWQDDDS